MKKLYLAGPDIFRPDQQEYGNTLKRICNHYGLEGLWPLDNQVDLSDCPSGPEKGLKIYDADVKLIDQADALVANLTPFRGISADPGTCFEMGYAVAQGKPVFAYSLDRNTTYKNRAIARGFENDGNHLEDFGLTDNLMMIGPTDNQIYGSVDEAIIAIANYFKENS